MSKFKRASTSVESRDVEAFVNGAGERAIVLSSTHSSRTAPMVSFVLKLEPDVHDLLKNIAETEDRSMQWMLRKMTAEVIKKKAEELGIAS
jgi:hypothetical protein